MDSIRSILGEVASTGGSSPEESVEQDGFGPPTTVYTRHLANAIAGGGVLGEHGGTVAAADQARGFGGRGGGGGGAHDDCVLLEGDNQLEEDRKIRRRQVERTAARLTRVREGDGMKNVVESNIRKRLKKRNGTSVGRGPFLPLPFRASRIELDAIVPAAPRPKIMLPFVLYAGGETESNGSNGGGVDKWQKYRANA